MEYCSIPRNFSIMVYKILSCLLLGRSAICVLWEIDVLCGISFMLGELNWGILEVGNNLDFLQWNLEKKERQSLYSVGFDLNNWQMDLIWNKTEPILIYSREKVYKVRIMEYAIEFSGRLVTEGLGWGDVWTDTPLKWRREPCGRSRMDRDNVPGRK